MVALGLLLFLLVLLTYRSVWRFGFIWDDDYHVTANPCVIGPWGLAEIWTTRAARICPLVITSFWLQHKIWGLNPLPYHLVNVVLHAASAILLWQVLRKLSVRAAWFGAALWALHPVQAESVAWITELKNVQSGFFYLLAILFFVRAEGASSIGENGGGLVSRPGEPSRRSEYLDYGLSLVFAAMAMASKSSTVILPLVLGLCAWWIHRRWPWRSFVRLAPFFLMTVAASLWSMWSQRSEGAFETEWMRTPAERLITAGKVIWFYLDKVIWPHPLIFVYPRWQIQVSVFDFLPAIFAATLLVFLWWKRQGKLAPAFFAYAYFVAALLPVLGLIDHFFLRYSFVGDHFQYLASMGPLALASAAMSSLGRGTRMGRRITGVVLACTIVGLTHLTWVHSQIFANDETLFRVTVEQNPESWMAHNNLGLILAQTGQVDEAIGHYEKALALRPTHAPAHYNLGNALRQKEDLPAAVNEYRKAVELAPNFAPAHYNLGLVLLGQRQVDPSIVEFRKALELVPSDPEMHLNLGNAFRAKGQTAEALVEYRKAVELRPRFPDATSNLGSVLLEQGRAEEAVTEYEKALATAPNDPATQNNIGYALLQLGRVNEAIAHYEKAIALEPDNVLAHNNLAKALVKTGRPGQAIGHWERSLALQSNDASVANDLAWLLATSQDDSVRDGRKAARLAFELNLRTEGKDPTVLRTLAAAYAETGQFAEAVKTAELALEKATAEGKTDLAEALRKEIALYQTGAPYHQAPK